MIEVTELQQGCRFQVRVTPKAHQVSIGGSHDGAIKISVHEPAENGKANSAVVKALAKTWGIAKSDVQIIGGATSRVKTVIATGVTKEQVLSLA